MKLKLKQIDPGTASSRQVVLFDNTSGEYVSDSITKSDVGLSNVDNTSDINKPVSTATQAVIDQLNLDLNLLIDDQAIRIDDILGVDLPLKANLANPTFTGNVAVPTPTLGTSATNKTYVDSAINSATVGLLDDRGNYDASVNTFPTMGGSGASGAVLKGDLWTVSVAGTLGGVAVTAGDVIRALVDSPAQTSTNWAVSENNIGYVAENSANKDSNTALGTSNTAYPTQNAVKTYTDAGLALKENSVTAGTSTQYYRGDKTFQTLDTLAVPENTNLYFTNARARSALSVTAPLTYNSTTGLFGIGQSTTTTDGYLSSTDWNTFNNKQSLLPTWANGQILFGDADNVPSTSSNLFWNNTLFRLGIKTSSPISKIHIIDDEATSTGSLVERYGSGGSYFKFRRANGTVATPTALTATQVIGKYSFEGYNGTGFTTDGAIIQAVADEAFTGAAGGTKLEFHTTTNGTVTSGIKATLANDGKFAVGGSTIPTSHLQSLGSFGLPYRAVTANYTAISSDHTVDCTNAITITLPTATGITGRIYHVKNSNTGLTAVTVQGTGGQTIDGSATDLLGAKDSGTYQSTGSGWIII